MMIKFSTAKKLFVRQYSINDCGTSCLSMIFNYAGFSELGMEIIKMPDQPEGWSLGELKKMAENLGLYSRAVELDIDTLKNLNKPCILHTKGHEGRGHYVVCFGYSNKGYLIADPALHIGYMSEHDLQTIWLSKAALIFNELPPQSAGTQFSSWWLLYSFSSIPLSFFITLSLTTVITASSGIALTWYLQKAGNSSSLTEPYVITIMLILLTGIGVFRALTNLTRQRILTGFNLRFNGKLMLLYLDKLSSSLTQKGKPLLNVKAVFSDIQKMQNAASAFVATVVSDSVIIMVMIGAMAYLIPMVVPFVLIYLILIIYLGIVHIDGNTLLYNKTNQLSINLERQLSGNSEAVNLSVIQVDRAKLKHQELLASASHLALKSGRFLFVCETIGIVALSIVILISFAIYLNGQIPFTNLVATSILMYLINNLIPRIYAAVEIVESGADAAIQFKRILMM